MNLNNWETKLHKVLISKLKLWLDNPRLSSEIKPRSDTEYADIFIYNNDEKDDFLKLVKSIAENGFKSYNTIMTWKDGNSFYVAEGNRRVLAIKLLLKPNIAPESIRKKIEAFAVKVNKDALKSISVIVAPDFDSTEWYINQQNNLSSLKKSWTRRSQVKWIYDLYVKHHCDIDATIAKTEMKKGDAHKAIRLHKIFQFIDDKKVVDLLDQEQYKKASSYLFPVTALERFMLTSDVQHKWGIEYEDEKVTIISNMNSFLTAFAELIKLIVNEERDTRNLSKKDVSELLQDRRFTVSFEKDLSSLNNEANDEFGELEQVVIESNENKQQDLFDNENNDLESTIQFSQDDLLSGAAFQGSSSSKSNRLSTVRKVLIPNRCAIKIKPFRINSIYKELKSLQIEDFSNGCALLLRTFLEFSIEEFRSKYQLVNENTKLSSKLDVVKKYLIDNNHLTDDQIKSISIAISSPDSILSVHTMHSYVHNPHMHPTAHDLKITWDNMQIFIMKLWELI